MIATRLRALPQVQLEALQETASAIAASGLAVVAWMRDATDAEIARRDGAISVIPAVPRVDGPIGVVALASIIAQFRGQDEFAPTVAFLEAVVAALQVVA